MNVWERYLKGVAYKRSMNLYDTVETNENFFIGKQWEGVQSNGLPTPVFNFLKRVVNFLVASISTDNVKMVAGRLGDGAASDAAIRAVNRSFESLFELGDMGGIIRKMLRNAAVDGDGCIYAYWDSEVETGYPGKGEIRTEIIENTRVIFGNPNDRRVQKQPYIIMTTREDAGEVSKRARRFKSPDWEAVRPEANEISGLHDSGDSKVTVLLHLRRDEQTGRIFAEERTQHALVRPEWDTGLSLYPMIWLCWDEVRDSCHGMAVVTGLIPNQVFVNKLFAMAMISLMTTAYPKIVYDKTRVEKWDSRVGAAIGVNGGDVNSVARIIDPAQISPQISQFIELAISYTQNFMGATDTALGNVRPENTSAIIAIQRASNIPIEMVKMELYRAIEELGRIFLDLMGAYYGRRPVKDEGGETELFDFSQLAKAPLRLKLDVGASNYWSEIASVQTMDNLLAGGRISLADYLERIPDGYLVGKEELLEKARKSEERGELSEASR